MDQGGFWNNPPDPLVAHPQELGNVQEHLDALAIQIRGVGEVEDETGRGVGNAPQNVFSNIARIGEVYFPLLGRDHDCALQADVARGKRVHHYTAAWW